MALWRAVLLSPVILPQLIWVRMRAARLPEAAGPREGVIGQGAVRRVLIVGDSTAAGVGAQTQAEALSGQVAGYLARDCRVEWRLVARSGAEVPDTLEMLSEEPESSYDYALICLGVNDAKNGRFQPRFEEGYAALLRTLSDRFGVRQIVCSGLPPKVFFPLLPRPLRDVLGARMIRFDRAIAHMAAEHRGATHLALDFTNDVSLVASDGFHPGPEIYRMWAERAAKVMRAE